MGLIFNQLILKHFIENNRIYADYKPGILFPVASDIIHRPGKDSDYQLKKLI
jgi:hypothetical protein